MSEPESLRSEDFTFDYQIIRMTRTQEKTMIYQDKRRFITLEVEEKTEDQKTRRQEKKERGHQDLSTREPEEENQRKITKDQRTQNPTVTLDSHEDQKIHLFPFQGQPVN